MWMRPYFEHEKSTTHKDDALFRIRPYTLFQSAPPEGGDIGAVALASTSQLFQSAPPKGRQLYAVILKTTYIFQSARPSRDETTSPKRCPFLDLLYHINYFCPDFLSLIYWTIALVKNVERLLPSCFKRLVISFLSS